MAWSPIGSPSRERPAGNAVAGWPATVDSAGYTRPWRYGTDCPSTVEGQGQVAVVGRPRARDVRVGEHVDGRGEQHVPLLEERAPARAELLAPAVPRDVVARPRLEPAQMGARELVVHPLVHGDALAARLLVHARARHRGEERAVERVLLALVAQDLGLGPPHGAPEPPEPRRQILERRLDLGVHRVPRDRRQHRHAEVGEALVARRAAASPATPRPRPRRGPPAPTAPGRDPRRSARAGPARP